MKTLLVISALLGIVILACLLLPCSGTRPELDEQWENFKTSYNKAYGTDEEETKRREIWEQHHDFILKHNEEYEQGLHTYSVGENEFADLSHEEFLSILYPWPVEGKIEHLGGAPLKKSSRVLGKDIPDSVDWREKNVVTDVKNQLQCGSCYAFAATGSLEGFHAIATGNLVSLSEQNIVDCSQDEGNLGCSGGFPDWAFEYIIKNGGIDTEASYPYVAKNQQCQFNASNVGATMKSYQMIPSGSDDELLKAIAEKGPIAVGMDAAHESFQLYKTGIYNPTNCSKIHLDHGILAVGYGEERGQKFWIVKNSWGTTWGENGYFQLNREEVNMCGISTRSSYPEV